MIHLNPETECSIAAVLIAILIIMFLDVTGVFGVRGFVEWPWRKKPVGSTFNFEYLSIALQEKTDRWEMAKKKATAKLPSRRRGISPGLRVGRR